MTKRAQRRLTRYLEALAPRLGLHGWRIEVVPEFLPDDDSAIARVDQVYGSKHAVVEVRADFFEAGASYQREVCVHELLHCVFAAPQRLVFEELGEYMPRPMHLVFEDSWRMAQEYSIDALACAIAPTMPYPGQVVG